MPVIQYILLLIVSGFGGAFSGLLVMTPNGWQAVALSFCLTLGSIWLAEKQRRTGRPVQLPDALAVGLVAGTVAVIPVALLESLRPPNVYAIQEQFNPPELNAASMIIMPISYGVLMHWAYFRRHGSRKPYSKVLLRMLAWIWVMRLVVEATIGSHKLLPFLIFIPVGVLTLVAPFPFFWLCAHYLFDPAFEAPPRSSLPEPCKHQPETTIGP